MRIPVLRGRAFNASDDPDNTVILNRRLAVAMYGTADVVGEGFPRSAPSQRIVGVVGDAPFHRMDAPDQVQTIYVPMRSSGAVNASLVVRAKSDPALLAPLVRDAVRRADDRVIAQPQLLRDRYEEKLAGPRLARAATSLAAVLAVALACIGVFSVASYGVRLRLKEIGIRIVLGASRAEIAKLVAGQSAALIVFGTTVGLVASSLLMKLFAGAPFYLTAPNRWIYLTALVILLAAAALALATPMRRALHTDPATTLRQE
jgi:predicted lysophospholipase L1 biosynthesis ABC-type transport system permease subunit